MSLLLRRFPGADLPWTRLGRGPTPVRELDGFWLKDESVFGDGGWGGNKVRKLEWILPDVRRRKRGTLLTVGGIGTHWGLAAALYGREEGLRVVLGLVDQPVDDHVREQTRRLDASGAVVHRFRSVARLRAAAPFLLTRYADGLRTPAYLPAGGSSPVGTLGYVETALEIAEQVRSGLLPEPATVVTAVGSGGTAAGLTLGLRMAGLRSRVLGVVVNDSFRLDAVTVARLADDTASLLRTRGALVDVRVGPDDLDADHAWLGATYGASTPESEAALAWAAEQGLHLEPVYTAKALAAVRARSAAGPVLFLQTHGPRPQSRS
ncbi:1-aminocyclopropane-1-carboxylate deaminase/D-cysteine desulfhydrase [Aeromicrobium erythreum]|uniref:1-aminocyclopropane-1-carboxylate deaminase n=1 Tax=Aeromicrobium erythreum TaxID=2041 RepID=A0A0U4BCK5_9ACTN|nr:pyridoxal-phosphate dependent enzyme [Aeromicrobium erythreum]ALX05460.1 1-aminocyclopropane-1-carboxylate deaminase [Aeromicrobium erythreum]